MVKLDVDIRNSRVSDSKAKTSFMDCSRHWSARVRCATMALPSDADCVKEVEIAENAASGEGVSFEHHLMPALD